MDGGEARTPELWYRSLPPLTRFGVTVTFILTLAATVGLFDPSLIILDWQLVLHRLQGWRLVTDYFFAGAFSLGWLFHMYFLVTFSSKLEVNEMFTASPGAYLFFLLFQFTTLDVFSLILYWPTGKPVLAPAVVMAIIYYWSRREPYSPIGLWGFTLQAYQFPFALLFLDLIMGHSVWLGIMGLLSGHLYYFLKDVLPQEKGIDVLGKTPRLCDEIMRRCARFDHTNLVGSLKTLVWGADAMPAQARDPLAFPRPFSTLQGTPSGTAGRSFGTEPRLFSGEGRTAG